ncbi:MAG: dCTP deaminase [Caldilineaceae bacterium]|nr:dCTP deaminase [Caldilineaceae bacterium]
MAVLCDFQLLRLCCDGMIEPFDRELINPASIDLRVGNTFCSYHDTIGWLEPRLFDGYELAPGQTVLLDTLEYVRIPPAYMAEMWLKSSAGRLGFDLYKAGYIDPGFEGTLTFRLTNQVRKSLPIYPGQKLVQMVVREMATQPLHPYKGHYVGQRGPTVAYAEFGDHP